MDREHISDSWERGSPYEQYVGRWSRQIAPLFLSWLNIPNGRRWLDVGCGTGALPIAADGTILLTARSWAARGTVAM
ncbi:MAG TPA: hypothetical protein PKC65_14390 [Pyrinomonadaceae bacterium]|nr:hypothetical protein [Pyrinomonadaceae bacterium]